MDLFSEVSITVVTEGEVKSDRVFLPHRSEREGEEEGGGGRKRRRERGRRREEEEEGEREEEEEGGGRKSVCIIGVCRRRTARGAARLNRREKTSLFAAVI